MDRANPERVTTTGATRTCRSSESASLSHFLAQFLVPCDVHNPGSHEKCPEIVTILKCHDASENCGCTSVPDEL